MLRTTCQIKKTLHHDKLFFMTIEGSNKPNCEEPGSGLGSASSGRSVAGQQWAYLISEPREVGFIVYTTIKLREGYIQYIQLLN